MPGLPCDLLCFCKAILQGSQLLTVLVNLFLFGFKLFFCGLSCGLCLLIGRLSLFSLLRCALSYLLNGFLCFRFLFGQCSIIRIPLFQDRLSLFCKLRIVVELIKKCLFISTSCVGHDLGNCLVRIRLCRFLCVFCGLWLTACKRRNRALQRPLDSFIVVCLSGLTGVVSVPLIEKLSCFVGYRRIAVQFGQNVINILVLFFLRLRFLVFHHVCNVDLLCKIFIAHVLHRIHKRRNLLILCG